jgi:hypothetical protein
VVHNSPEIFAANWYMRSFLKMQEQQYNPSKVADEFSKLAIDKWLLVDIF